MTKEELNASISISSQTIETIIGTDTKFKGSIDTDKPIKIDGMFEGTIHTTDEVFVSESGRINADIVCKDMKLFGKGEGKVTCTHSFTFAETGVFTGDIQTNDLITVSGATFDGNCKMGGVK